MQRHELAASFDPREDGYTGRRIDVYRIVR
jgi:hypothetical protein